MGYTPTIWIDHVTTLGPTNLNKLENGLAAAAGVADGAQSLAASAAAAAAAAVQTTLADAKGDLFTGRADNVIGRLGIGADGQVLTAEAAQVSGMKWGSAPVYPSLVDAKGDLLVGSADDVLAKLPVGTDGQLLTADAAQSLGVKWASPAVVGFGTSLPGSPTNGDEFVLVDSLTLPTYAHRFKYIAGISDAYKWIFIGGSSAYVVVPTPQGGPGTTYGDCSTIGPSFTVVRAGIYVVEQGFVITGGTAVNTIAMMSYTIGGTAAQDTDAAKVTNAQGTANDGSTMMRLQKTLAASTALVAKYRTSTSNVNFGNRWLSVTPVRVS